MGANFSKFQSAWVCVTNFPDRHSEGIEDAADDRVGIKIQGTNGVEL
jgi:hypothetical protein